LSQAQLLVRLIRLLLLLLDCHLLGCPLLGCQLLFRRPLLLDFQLKHDGGTMRRSQADQAAVARLTAAELSAAGQAGQMLLLLCFIVNSRSIPASCLRDFNHGAT
jgi:hypothetical protein